MTRPRRFIFCVAHPGTVIFRCLALNPIPQRRAEFWSKADASSPDRWKHSTRPQRDYIWQEVIGRVGAAYLPQNVRTRLIYDEPRYRGYEVVLDVWPGVIAYGILLVPKDIKPGERRPLVVCQHGLEGRPSDVADAKIDSPYYHRFAARLAEEGFVTYAPQNPYIGEDRFRATNPTNPLRIRHQFPRWGRRGVLPLVVRFRQACVTAGSPGC